MRRVFLLALWLAVASPVSAQITVPNTLVAGATIAAAGLNTNFTTIANHALDRLAGGNIAGNVTADVGVTIDGVDIGVQACVACTPTFAKITLTNATTTSFVTAGGGQFGAATNIGGLLTVTGGLTIGSGVVTLVDATGKISALSATTLANLSGASLTGLLPTALTGAGRIPSAANYQRAYVSKSALYTAVAATDDDIDCDVTAGGFTITLPTPVGNTGKQFDIKKTDATANVCTVGTAAGNIDGSATFAVAAQNQNMTFRSNGTNWEIR